MTKQYNVVVLGASGAVGQTAIQILEQRNFPVKALFPLASARSAGNTVTFKGKEYPILDAATFDFTGMDIAIFSAGADISLEYAPKAAAAGCVVIDNTTAFRYEDDVPLVVPEVNADKIADYKNRNIIANPNCTTVQLVVALKPIYDAVGIDKINYVSYQSVSGAGKEGIDELLVQTSESMEKEPMTPEVFRWPIAFNLIPHIDSFVEDDFTKEEMKVVWETQKIMNDKNIKVNPTAVRVPVLIGHSEAVTIETKHPISVADAKALLAKAEGVSVIDDPANAQYPMPAIHGTGTDDVYVGRIRKDLCHENGLNLWIVADNVRKGAALNAVQIAEKLLRYLQ